MLKLSKLADYAIVIISSLNHHKDELVSASVLAGDARLPEPTVAKVLKLLAADNIVASIRGVKGGYKLSRPLDQISIKDIITALDGPIALTACVEDSGDGCELSSYCAMHGRWDSVNKAIKQALEDVSVASMIEKQPAKKRA